MRAFVGLPLPDKIISALERVQAELSIGGRAVAPENLHLTLAFLDEQPEMVLAALHDELALITGSQPCIRIAGLDALGGAKARLVFAAVAPDPALVSLRKRVRIAARAVGVDLQRERFRPHVTLARFRQRQVPGESEKLAAFLAREGAFSLPEFMVADFALYRSTLTPEGPIYDTLASYPLAIGPDL